MKSKIILTIFVLALVLSLSSVTALAASDQNSKVITVNPFGFIIGSYNFNFEQQINSHQSFLLGATYFSINLFDEDINIYNARLGMRFYKDNAVKGIYFGPLASAGLATASGEGSVVISLGGVAGYQWIYNGGFVLDLSIGADYNIYTDDILDNGFSTRLGIGLGFNL